MCARVGLSDPTDRTDLIMFVIGKNLRIIVDYFFVSYVGIAGGLSSSPISVYSAEIAHSSIRGRLIVLTSIAIAFGVLTIYFFGFLIQVCVLLNELRFIVERG